MIDDQAIVTVLRREFPDVVAIYRFGSTAAGQATPASDVDVAFLVDRSLDPLRADRPVDPLRADRPVDPLRADRPVDPLRRFEVQERLAVVLRRDVDLVDLEAASTVLRMQVIAHGLVLATFDEKRRGQFEDYVYSSYARLNEERREILQRIAEEGSVYGG